MAAGDELDFGFLNEDSPPPESTDQFSFTEPTETTGNQPSAAPEPQPSVSPPAASVDRPSKRRKLSPVKKAQRPAGQDDQTSEATTNLSGADSSAPAAETALKADSVRIKRSKAKANVATAADSKHTAASSKSDASNASTDSSSSTVPKAQFLALAVFAGLVSILLLLQMLGMINLGGSHQLESVPDVAPLKAGEFQPIPETAALPTGHELRLGEAAQFGDVMFTPTKVVREPVAFVHMTSGKPADNMLSQDVLKLYFTIQNMSNQLAFAPWDVALMNHRTPAEGIDPSTKANSWLRVTAASETERVLNFFHSPNSNFNIVGMQSRVALQPQETRETFIASSEDIDGWLKKSAELRWRLQLRKGVHLPSERSVTTFVDVTFAEADIQQL